MRRILVTITLLLAAVGALWADDDSYNMSRGIDALQQGNTQEAIRYFLREAEADDTKSEPWFLIAQIMKDEDRLGASLTALCECLKRIPEKNKEKRAEALFSRSLVFLEIGDTLHAENDLLEVAQLQPGDVDYQNRLGDFYYDRHMWNTSDTYYNQALKLEPQNWYATMGLGRNESERKAFDKALQWYDKAYAIDPDQTSVYAFKGESLMGLGRWNEAAECLLDGIASYDRWADDLFDQLSDSALDVAIDAVELRYFADTTATQWVEQLVLTNFAGDRFAESKRWIDKYLEDNEEVGVYPYLAHCAARLGDYQGLLAALNRAEMLDSTNVDLLGVRTRFEMEWGHYGEALKLANKLVDGNPEDADAYLLRADILLAQGNTHEALDDYITASVLNEDIDRALIRAGQVCLIEGNEEKARQCFTKLVEKYKSAQVGPYTRVQEAYYYLGDTQQAQDMAQRVLAAKGEINNNSLIMGQYYSLIGDQAKAKPLLEHSVEIGEVTPWMLQQPYDLYRLRTLPYYNQLLEQSRKHFHTTE